MIFKLVRWPLGQLILLLDFLTSPRPLQRSPEAQAAVDAQTRDLLAPQLYELFRGCYVGLPLALAFALPAAGLWLYDGFGTPEGIGIHGRPQAT